MNESFQQFFRKQSRWRSGNWFIRTGKNQKKKRKTRKEGKGKRKKEERVKREGKVREEGGQARKVAGGQAGWREGEGEGREREET